MLKCVSRIAGALAIAAALMIGSANAGSVADAKTSGKLVMGIEDSNPPWGFINASGQIDGLDAAVSRALAKYLGVEAEFVPVTIQNRTAALNARKVDVLMQVAMTAERAKSVQFSRPYTAFELSVTAPKSSAISKPQDLSGLKLGLVRSSALDVGISKIAPKDTEILRFDDDATVIQSILSGQVNAIGATNTYFTRLEQAAPGVYEVKIQLNPLFLGLASRLGEADWNSELNAFLDEFVKTDEYKAIYEKWLQSPVPAFPSTLQGIPFVVKN